MVVATAAGGTKRTAVVQCRRKAREAGAAGAACGARAEPPRGAAVCVVKASFTLAKDRRDLMQPMRAQPEGNKAAPGLCLRDAPWGLETRRPSRPARGGDRTRPRSCRTPARR